MKSLHQKGQYSYTSSTCDEKIRTAYGGQLFRLKGTPGDIVYQGNGSQSLAVDTSNIAQQVGKCVLEKSLSFVTEFRDNCCELGSRKVCRYHQNHSFCSLRN